MEKPASVGFFVFKGPNISVDRVKSVFHRNSSIPWVDSAIFAATIRNQNPIEMEQTIEKYGDQLVGLALEYGPKLVLALITLIIGLWIIKMVVRGIDSVMVSRNLDESLRPFLKSLLSNLFKALLFISVISMVGVEMTSFIAILGAAGLAVGMALSGTLQNFAGGVMILIFKPFQVGHFIEAQGYSGTVKEIQIFNTILTTPDNKTIIIPNGGLATSSMINYSAQETRRVDFEFGIGYGDDISKAKQVLLELIKLDERIKADPEPFVAVKALADSSVNLVVRVWCDSGDYWGIFFDMQENVKNAFDSAGINIPFPQRDVHLYSMNN